MSSMSNNKKFHLIFKTWLIAFSIIPFALILGLSFFDGNGHITRDNYYAILDPIYIRLIVQSIINASIITIASVVIVLPLTYLITLQKNRKFWLLLFLVPTWVNLLLKAYAFIGLLGSHGIVNNLLSAIGISEVSWLFNIKGFLIVTVYIYMPFMMLPLYNSIVKIPENVIKAARDLGSSETNIFFKIIIPLSRNAILSGVTLVFIPSLSIFMITRLITGNKVMTLGTAIEQQFLVTGDWNMGSSLAVMLIVIMILFSSMIGLINHIQVKRREDV